MHRVWTRRSAASLALWPLSQLYGALVVLRKLLYRAGMLRSARLPVPVIVVGNVVAGGAGKTPVVMALVQHLKARGLRPGVVSRGYGRSSRGTHHVEPDSAAKEVGDEPALIARRCAVPVVVATRRSEAAEALLARHTDIGIIVCDDGLQHVALARDLEICVFSEHGIGNGWLLPAGPLREPWPRTVDFVLHAGSPPPYSTNAAYFSFSRRLADSAITADGQHVSLSSLCGETLIAVAGTARPDDFFSMLRARGLHLEQTLALPDHFDFDNWKPNAYKRHRLVCTEKDAVKLWPLCPDALAVPLISVLPDDFWAALDAHTGTLLNRPTTV